MNDKAVKARLAAEYVLQSFPGSGTGAIDGEHYACCALNRADGAPPRFSAGPAELAVRFFVHDPAVDRKGEASGNTELTALFDYIFRPVLAGIPERPWSCPWEEATAATQEFRATMLCLFAAMLEAGDA